MVEEKIDSKVVKNLYQPPTDSHKGQSGVVLIVGGSKKFHGAPLFAAKVASKIVDLVYFSSVPENNELIKKMKSELCDFIAVPRGEVISAAEKSDCILIGPGLGVCEETKQLTNGLLKKFPDKKLVLDADSLIVLDKSLLNKNCVVTPHSEEFRELFGIDASKETVIRMAKKYSCIVVLKGVEDYVSDGEELRVNTTGNAGMT
ncbi:MAG: NAD(P)H-hydrate dehydratase, partial [Candidatus Woykebacteria bacterium GWA1_44_8]